MKHVTINVDFRNKKVIDRYTLEVPDKPKFQVKRNCCAQSGVGWFLWCAACQDGIFEFCFYR